MRVYFVNHTFDWKDGRKHYGCLATCESLMTRIKAAGHTISHIAYRPDGPIVEHIEDSDMLIVNGEGTFRDEDKNHEPGRHDRLFNGMTMAKDMRKSVFLTNTVWCRMSDRWGTLLKRLDGVSVREPISAQEMLRQYGIAPDIHADEALFVKVDGVASPGKFGIYVGNFQPGNCSDGLSETHGELEDFSPLGLFDRPWTEVVQRLRSATLYLTGQHHGVLAAIVARCPFAAGVVNTHKLDGIFQWANAEIPMAANVTELLDIGRWAISHPQEYEKLWAWHETLKPWPVPT